MFCSPSDIVIVHKKYKNHHFSRFSVLLKYISAPGGIGAFVLFVSIISLFVSPERAHAALTLVGVASSTGASANFALSLTALQGGIGSAPIEGDLVIVTTGFGGTANLDPGVTTAGYTEEADLYGNDQTDDANLSVDWKIMGAVPDTTVTCLGSTVSTNGAGCVVHVWR